MDKIVEFSNPKTQELMLTVILGIFNSGLSTGYIVPYQTLFYRGALQLYSSDIKSISLVITNLYDTVWVESGIMSHVKHTYNVVTKDNINDRDWVIVDMPKEGLAIGQLYGVPEQVLRDRTTKFKIVEIQKIVLNKNHKDLMRLKERVHTYVYSECSQYTPLWTEIDIRTDTRLNQLQIKETEFSRLDDQTTKKSKKQRSKSNIEKAKIEKKREKLTKQLSTLEEKIKDN